jgi:hypothetical protein
MLWLIFVASSLDVSAASGEPPPQAVVGGTPAEICDFPADVFIGNGGANCTASLVHPRVLITAAHCLGGISMAGFGESAYSPVMTVAVQSCQAHPSYYQWGLDLAVCVLAQDAPAVAMVPVLMGCEADELMPGREIIIAGFGMSNEASGTGGGVKRYTSNTIDSVSYQANEIYLLGNGNGSCYGDSGGPAYIRLEDGTWRVIAAVQGPHPQAPPLGCGFGGTYTLIHPQMEWIESTTGYDITPCFDADGTWNPDERCTEFPTQLHGFGSGWDTMCSGIPLSGPGQSCGAPDPDLDPGGDATGGDESGSVDDGSLPPDPSDDHGDADGSTDETGPVIDATDAGFDEPSDDDGFGPGQALPPAYGEVRNVASCRVHGAGAHAWILLLSLVAVRRPRRLLH